MITARQQSQAMTKIQPIQKSDYPELLEVWEKSVRATHHFLSKADIASLKPLILNQYFDAVTLHCVKDKNGRIKGFCGVADDNLEMLFVDPDCHGTGVGKCLCQYAIEVMKITRVDVNEQNPQAMGFYEHMGFSMVSRSPVDGQGKPFPLLHLKLSRAS